MSRHELAIEYIKSHILNAPSYHPKLPYLDEATWYKAFNWMSPEAVDRNKKFQRYGSFLIKAIATLRIGRQFCSQGEGLFERIRSIIAHNETFSALTHKLAFTSKQGADVKISDERLAAVFKVVVTEVCLQHGFENVCVWIGSLFDPLLPHARDVCRWWSGPPGTKTNLKNTNKSQKKISGHQTRAKRMLLGTRTFAGPSQLSKKTRSLPSNLPFLPGDPKIMRQVARGYGTRENPILVDCESDGEVCNSSARRRKPRSDSQTKPARNTVKDEDDSSSALGN
ncbi:hypothetical protein M422DRAFT_49955 [Sphaerobolus stellatus SS14]|uniref:Uncharacterized protein n=1 Tax=Sphaerobolus stellatus (strain SS14) TaxID=990650 RepID=A0A0C9VKY6_SPHS4|nr:hypothetical protein M422DRAFT_49955 [Sphaerobolus stellatus SS14]